MLLQTVILAALMVQDDAAGIDFFEKKVRPVLVESCASCHSSSAKKIKGGLLLDTPEGILKGGDTGPSIVPGKPEASLLIKALRWQDPELQMPPKKRLPEAAIADLVRWVAMGAPHPAAMAAPVVPGRLTGPTPEEGAKHWAFRPVRQVAVPPKAPHPIDAFILAALDAQGLAPARPADKATLLRRVTVDLTGLPPTPDDLETFLKDASADAYEKVVDRLLASPRYGEHWGRHWLDLVRYADSNGVDEDVNHPHAWRYRDYVIAAINQDKPYDHFVREQLAGDLAAVPSAEGIIATGWLALGPKMLAEPDLEKMKMDIADEQIDVMSKTFLGLTVSCARCHDHKFDPVRTVDYYALAGIFRSTSLITDYKPRPAILYEAVLPLPGNEEIEAQHAATVSGIQEELSAVAADEKRSKELKERLKKTEGEGAALPRAMSLLETAPRDLAVHIRGSHLALAKDVTPRGFPKVFESALKPPPVDPKRSGRAELAAWLTDPAHPLTARVMVNRLWQGHFGEGLVRTPSNFGLKGEAPTHPELLDWLASEFIRQGWSMKRMHRLIVTSATYRRSSAAEARLAEKDPENRLLGRQNRRRLEAESVRDALLYATGSLDLTMGGSVPGVPTGKSYYKGDATFYLVPRRTVYLPVPRQSPYELLAIFDYADTAVHLDKRPVTTVAPQALFMMNNSLVRQQAKILAEDLIKRESDDDARARRAWTRLFTRPASAEEVRTILYHRDRFLKTGSTPAVAWTNVVHALMASNEFLFVD
jgi:mono/diheme cytochrome c family protein